MQSNRLSPRRLPCRSVLGGGGTRTPCQRSYRFNRGGVCNLACAGCIPAEELRVRGSSLTRSNPCDSTPV